MDVRIIDIKQLGIGWEILFRPPDREKDLQEVLEGEGLRVVLVRRGPGSEGGEVGSIECERPGAELSKAQLADILTGRSGFEVADHLKE